MYVASERFFVQSQCCCTNSSPSFPDRGLSRISEETSSEVLKETVSTSSIRRTDTDILGDLPELDTTASCDGSEPLPSPAKRVMNEILQFMMSLLFFQWMGKQRPRALTATGSSDSVDLKTE